MGKQDRLLMILNLLSSRQRMSVAELAGECGVTERTIYRDVADIARANYPIYYDRGYRLLRGENLPPFNVTAEEHAVLKTILAGWPLAGLAGYGRIMRGLTAKLERYYRQSASHLAPPHAEPLSLHPKTTSAAQRIHLIMSILVQAADHRKTVEFDYTNLRGARVRRRVDPYFVVFRGRAFYLIGKCHLRGEIRLFRLDRIARLAVTDRQFSGDPSVTPESLFAYSWDVYLGPPVTVRVRLRGRAKLVVESGVHHPTEQITRSGPRVIVSDSLFLSLTRRLFLPVDSFSTPITTTVHGRFSPSSNLLMYRVKQYATRCMVCEKTIYYEDGCTYS